MGMEQLGKVATGLGFGAEKGNKIIKENKEYYEKESFLDKNGKFLRKICVEITTNILKKYGLKPENKVQKIESCIIYPQEYFCPLKMGTNRLTITKNTYSIHHYSASWKSNSKILRRIGYYLIPCKQFIKRIIMSHQKINK